jgi:hypothetical protein
MRNFLAGTTKGKSKTAKYYHENPEAREKKVKYDMKYHDTEERREYRRDLQRINRKNGTAGNHDGKDVAHVSKTKTISQSQSANRADKKRNFFKNK